MFQRNRINVAVASVVAATVAGTAQAEIEEIVVTATKRTASTQDIPIAVQALGENSLEQLGINNFEDYLIQLPGVSAGGSGPAQNTIYIRGLASTTPNLTTAGVAGLAPNVAFYLDDQPLAQPGRNLDVYAADLNRIEVLSGPQGTLFGASSQAGNVRLITNKPDPSGTYGGVRLGTSFIEEGEMNNNVEAMINLPVSDRLTLRGVVFADNQGGYIDNVPGTLDTSQSARFRPASAVRSNGEPVGARAGFDAGADLSDVNFIEADNGAIAEDDFNETTYAGVRLSALWDVNEDWSLLVSHMQQTIDADGVFFADPELGEYEITRFQRDSLEDAFHNTSWTLEGLAGPLEVVYTGAFTDRDTDQLVDYSDYLFVGQYLPYYICDAGAIYIDQDTEVGTGTCQAPDLFVTSNTNTEVWTHEVRFNTPVEKPLRATVGAFFSDLELTERNDFTYPGSTEAVAGDGGVGFADNFPYQTGYTSDPGPFPAGVIFRNDIRRTDEQFGIFGEGTIDLGEQFALTVGARYYDIEVDFEGSANGSFCNKGLGGTPEDGSAFGTDISDLYNGDGEFTDRSSCGAASQITYTLDDIDDPATPANVVAALQAPDTAQTDGMIGKVSLQWTPTNNQLWYVTWSEGFRPGLLNRPGGATNGAGFTVPYAVDTDEVVNTELGWKLDLFDRTLRLNGNLFFVDVQDLQTTIFDPSITNLFFSDNAADAEIRGIEGDFIWTPGAIEGLTITGAFSFLDTEITDVITPTGDVREGDELAFAPEFQGTLRARYEWQMQGGLRAHVMPSMSYSEEAFTDIITINRMQLDSWLLVGLSAGVSAPEWTAELFVDNLMDEQAELSGSFVFDRERVVYARPRTVGVRFSYDF